MKNENDESFVSSGYVTAMDYLTVQSQRIDSVCNQLSFQSDASLQSINSASVAYVPVNSERMVYPHINNENTAYVPIRSADIIYGSSDPVNSAFVPVKNGGIAYVARNNFTAMSQPNLITAVGSVQKQFNTFNSIQGYLPDLAHLTTASPIIGYAREAIFAITELSRPSTLAGLATSVENNLSPWYSENIAGSSFISRSSYELEGVLETSKYVGSILGQHSLSALSVQSGIVKATEYSLYAEKSVFPVTNANIGGKIYLENETRGYLASSFIDLSQGYSSLIKSYEYNPLSYTQIDPSISRMAQAEYFSSANLLEAISVDEDITVEEELLKTEIQYENEILLNKYLPKLDPGLYKMWQGAIESYHSNNTDKVRHFSASLRELFTHFIHILAPDKEIKKWSTDSQFYYAGRPTRKARLLFICRNINNDPFNTFVKLDVDTTNSFIDIFQKGTHAIDPNFTPNQLVTIKSKAESILKFLLEIHFKTNI
jgi:hypothetical protein